MRPPMYKWQISGIGGVAFWGRILGGPLMMSFPSLLGPGGGEGLKIKIKMAQILKNDIDI